MKKFSKEAQSLLSRGYADVKNVEELKSLQKELAKYGEVTFRGRIGSRISLGFHSK